MMSISLCVDCSVSAAYSTVISTVCDSGTGNACTEAQQALLANTACYNAIDDGTDIDAICAETCRNLLNSIVSSCSASVSQTIAVELPIFYVIFPVIYF